MRKVQLLLLFATAGVCAAVAGTASAASNITVQVTTLTPPQAMPILFSGTPVMYGKRVNQGDPIPVGSAVVQITIPPLAGRTGPVLFTASCPNATMAMDYGVPAGVNSPAGGFDAPLGQTTMQFRYVPSFAQQTGPTNVYMLCMQGVSNLVRRLSAKVAPVTFPTAGLAKGIRRGQPLRPRQLLMKNELVGLKQGQATWAGTSCPKRYQPVLGASATKGVRALLEGDIINIPPVNRAITRATVYTVCEAFAGR